jgi:hypothetical protein
VDQKALDEEALAPYAAAAGGAEAAAAKALLKQLDELGK